jgi:threonine dehydrogenase-like Zn-dependent dehydrogenase
VHSRGFVWEELLQGYNNAPHSTFSGFERALRWLQEGRIPLQGLIHTAVPTDPAALYADILQRKIRQPFIALDWAGV